MWERALTQALLSMFSTDEFRRLLRWHYASVEQELPGSLASPASFFADAVSALDRRQALGGEFFRLLREERPRRVAEIDELERLWRAARATAPAAPAATAAAAAAAAAPATPAAPVTPTTPLAPAPASFDYDIFIAHASADRVVAESLFDTLLGLQPGVRLFLDTRSLKLGDAWDQAIPDALERSQVVVVLVSERIDQAWYARDEIAQAIELARDPGSQQKVVPVFLDGLPSPRRTGSRIPYGLRVLHGLILPDTGVEEAARRLLSLLLSMRA